MPTLDLPPRARPLLGPALATALMVVAMFIPDQSNTEGSSYPSCQKPGKLVTPREATEIVTDLGTYARVFAVPPEELDPQKVVCTVTNGGKTTLHIEESKRDFVDTAQELFPNN